MKIRALDLGTRRTGVAFADSENGSPLALDTIHHQSEEELIEEIRQIVVKRSIEKIVIGLPLLLSGKEGLQSSIVRNIEKTLQTLGPKIEVLDERFTTPQGGFTDPDSAAASGLLAVYLERQTAFDTKANK